MRVPDAIEPIVGWRCWRISDSPDGLVLLSACRPTRWAPGWPIESRCEQHGHPVPGRACTCGIYAAAEPILPVDYLPPHVKATATIRTQALLGYDVVMAVGRVALWGTVVECSFGWRAERGYPVELAIPRGIRHYRRSGRLADSYDSGRVADELAALYGIPVVVVDSLHPAAAA